jgi:hypothetical protein
LHCLVCRSQIIKNINCPDLKVGAIEKQQVTGLLPQASLRGAQKFTVFRLPSLNLSGKIMLYSRKASPANHKLYDKNFCVAGKTYKINTISKRP